MTLTELAGYDGQDGRRAYIAVNGTIYDVTDSPLWKDGRHHPDHQAGQDLTDELAKAPHVRTVVERFPVAGTLEEEVPVQISSGRDIMIIATVIVAAVIALLLFLVL
ncbi:MAG: cytochrome b5 domain-containing protein [Desulfuromonadales bacterium]|nr:cytochrome b5 domain-containing protein [Desulfuromonadales bacterium]